jgi:thiamine-monophosphate kinase
MAPSDPSSGEDRLIARYFRPIAQDEGALDLMDDAAILTPPAGATVILTTDAIVAGVHFFADDPADMVAKKALRVNLSDLAAKGAKPAGFLLTLALPETVGEDWLEAFARGLGEDADAYGCPLLGGDSVRTPGPVTISIAAFGTLHNDTMVRRSGAGPGHRILATGTIGDAALGLLLRRDPDAAKRWKLDRAQLDHLAGRYLLPQPRNAVAEGLRQHAAATIDVSDGLAGDLAKLCAASEATAEITVARVPLSDAAAAALEAEPELIETILTGGDDYEIVCTVEPKELVNFLDEADLAGVPVTEIGRVVDGTGPPRFLDRDGRPLLFKRLSFSHF